MFIAAARPSHESFLNNFLWQNICAASLNLIQFFCVQVCNLGRHAVLGEEREGTTVYKLGQEALIACYLLCLTGVNWFTEKTVFFNTPSTLL